MPDQRLRDLERRWRETGAEEDEAVFLAERVRMGELPPEVTALAAYFGGKVAHLVHGDVNTLPDQLMPQHIQGALNLLFGNKTELTTRAREFLEHIFEHDQEARATLAHYEIVQEGDVPPPETATAIKALMKDLQTHPNHLKAIQQMQRPVFQLIPVYEHEGVGFKRMVDAFDAHHDGQVTNVGDELRIRWRMNEESKGKILAWQVVVVEGASELTDENNPHCYETIEEQLRLWQQECEQLGLELSDNRSYIFLQMREIMISLEQLAIDQRAFTVLKDLTRQIGSPVPYGSGDGHMIYFHHELADIHYEGVCFRPSVVVNL